MAAGKPDRFRVQRVGSAVGEGEDGDDEREGNHFWNDEGGKTGEFTPPNFCC